MNLRSSILLALSGLQANKMRSLLTMLGIIIGVGAVIVMIALGQGARAQVAEQIASLGSNLLVVNPGAPGGSVRGAAGQITTLTWDDAKAIAELPLALQVAPELSTNVTANSGVTNWATSAIGTTPELQVIKNWPVQFGSFFSADEVNAAAPVAVLGQTVAENLFGSGVDPVGQTIRLNNLTVQVIGVLSPKGLTNTGSDQDNVVYIPLRTAQVRLTGATHVRTINVQAASAEVMEILQAQITDLLNQRHRIVPPAQPDFNVRNLTTVAETAEATTNTLTALLASVAAVSLMVGGIGIMNIMLVTVTERTREIGIRMAVGATPGAILGQFLVEAVVLSLLGGVIGVVVGLAGSWLISVTAGWRVVVSPSAILLATGFAGAVGVFFGYYPARKASDLDPIDALRYE